MANTPESASGEEGRRRPFHRRPLLLAAGWILAGAGIFFGLRYLVRSWAHESTDDAFIEGHIAGISSQVAGPVEKLLIDDNQPVEKGQLLLTIDPRNFETALERARASFDELSAARKSAEIDLERSRSALASAQGSAQEARARAAAVESQENIARLDLERTKSLSANGVASPADLDNATAGFNTARANFEAARKALAAAEAQTRQAQESVTFVQSQIEKAAAAAEGARAEVRQAELNLSYTKVAAPHAGRVTRRSVEPGAYVQVGQALLAIVRRDVWVLANFKETQLDSIRPGQAVRVRIDAYPELDIPATVDSIQAGSGARFSLFPPENAVGNYVKVVQRVPVKIVFASPPEGDRVIGPGLSVVPEILVREPALSTAALVAIAAAGATLAAGAAAGISLWRSR